MSKPGSITPIVIVGTGPVGMHMAKKLLEYGPESSIVLYGNEPWEPYNRVQLSTFLSGETNWRSLTELSRLPEDAKIIKRYNTPIVQIDRARCVVIDANGQEQAYSKLVLATGSSPGVPNIPGMDKQGIYTFRDMNDVQKLLARQVSSRKTVIIGGGVLGLEAARAMQRLNTEVTVIEHSPRLMSQQLDDKAGEMLREHLMSLGLKFSLFDGIKSILGEDRVTGIEMNSRRTIKCDTIIVVTGIKPNIQLARDCKLSIGRGIRVNDNMQTRDPDIYAVGECAEHRDRIYGLVAPGLEQAAVAAHSIMIGPANYQGSTVATQLKVVDQNVFSMGITGDEHTSFEYQGLTYEKPSGGIYRKLIMRRGRLVGVIAIGHWQEQSRIQEVITRKGRLWPWELRRFRRGGNLWPDTGDVNSWPAAATVCNCQNVCRGDLSKAIINGCNSIESLAEKTGASTVCGSCKPLLATLVGTHAEPEPLKARKSMLTSTLIAMALVLATLFLLPIPYASSMVPDFNIDILWRDGTLKQITGFTLLGLTLVGLLISMRKRIRKISFGDFAWWRLLHVALGALTLITLFAHTGFRLGENLNLTLMIMFLLLSFAGAISGMVYAVQDKLDAMTARRLRKMVNWSHIILFWPVPVLLSFHVLSVYYF